MTHPLSKRTSANTITLEIKFQSEFWRGQKYLNADIILLTSVTCRGQWACSQCLNYLFPVFRLASS